MIRLGTVALGVAVVAFAPASASAATFFVDAETVGDPACSQASPCTTINEAIAASRANSEVDTIKIATGLYGERLELTDPKDSGITIEGSGTGSDPGTNTVIQAGGPATFAVMALGSISTSETGMTARNLRVVNTTHMGRGTGIVVNASNSVLEDVSATTSAPANDYVLNISGNGARLERVTATAVGGPGMTRAMGLTAQGSLTVRDSDIIGAEGGGLFVGNNADLQLVRSRVTASPVADEAVRIQGTMTADSSLLAGGGTGLLYFGDPASPNRDAKLRGVTIDAGQRGVADPVDIAQGTGYAINVQGSNANLDSSIALERSSASGGWVDCSFSNLPDQQDAADPVAGTGPIGCGHGGASGNFSSLPADLFVNASSGDYRLKPGSPAFDRGSPRALEAGESPLDLAGATRAASARGVCPPRRDQGAFEIATGFACEAGSQPVVESQAVPARRDAIAPTLTAASLSRSVFAVGARPTSSVAVSRRRARAGTTLRFTLSEPARVKILIEARLAGRRVGRRCRSATRKLRKRRACVRWQRAGTLTRNLPAGRSTVTFSGRIGKRALKARRHRFALTATDVAGNGTSKPVRLSFRVVRR